MRFIHLFFLFTFLPGVVLYGQSSALHGKITDQDNNPIPGAIVIPAGSDSLIYTNKDGIFEISVHHPVHSLKVVAAGFLPERIEVKSGGRLQKITLHKIPHITNYNAREVIRLAKMHQKELEQKNTAFEADEYKKNQAFMDNVPFNIWPVSGTFIPEKSDSGELYWSEKMAHLRYYGLYNFNDTTVAFQAAGTLPIPEFNTLADLDLSIYHKRIFVKELSHRGYYTPFSERALRMYNFYAISRYSDEGRTVYRIGFQPKRNGSAALSGYCDIYDDTYTLGEVFFRLTAKNHLEMLDSFVVHQQYINLPDTHKMAYQQVHYYLNIFDFKASYNISMFYDRFRFINLKEVPKLDREVVAFDTVSVTSDDRYWKEHRKLPLSPTEQKLLQKDNLNALFREDYSQLGYLQDKFSPFKLFYKKYRFRNNTLYLNFSPLYYGIGFNNVEGAVFRYELPVKLYMGPKQYLISPEIRYGFTDRTLKLKVRGEYLFDLKNPKKLWAECGKTYSQFNEQEPILPIINSMYTLFLARNFMKLYAKNYLEGGFDWEITNGLEMRSSLEYAYRYPLFNHTTYHFLGDAKTLTPNNPIAPPVIDASGFDPHHALTLKADFTYQFKQLYQTINGKKVNLDMRTPRIYLSVKNGLKTFLSKTNYMFLSGGISFSAIIGNGGISRWDLSGGGFLYKKYLPFIDYKHFNGIQTFFLQPTPDRNNSLKQFSTLPYYAYSTRHTYVELHYEHSFDGYLLSRVPLMQQLQIHSFTGINYLNNFTQAQFIELFLGCDNILNVFRVEFAGGIDNFKKLRPKVRLGIDFNVRYYNRNKRR